LDIKTSLIVNVECRCYKTRTENASLLFGQGGGLLKVKHGGTHINNYGLGYRGIFRAINPWEYCGGQSDTGGGFPLINSLFTCAISGPGSLVGITTD
jgi:hypothetical protein